jgi:hypothetical protein
MFNIKTVPQIKIREGVSGNAEIKKLDYSYTLYVDSEEFMATNVKSSEQIRQFYSSYDLAKGDVLLTGLGFGILPLWAASKPGVTSVTVVEKSQGVVDLFLANNQLPSNMTIEVCDAYEYKTSRYFDCILLDHYDSNMLTPEQATAIADNIPNHRLMWLWAIELLIGDIGWEAVLNKYPIKLPNLSEDKLQEYLDTCPKRKGFLRPSAPDATQQVLQAENFVLDIS